MFITLNLANGESVVVNTNRIESIEKADDHPAAFEVHVGTMHYLIDAAEYAALQQILGVPGAAPAAAAHG